MSYSIQLFITIILLSFHSCWATAQQQQAPKAKKIPYEIIMHNDARIDNYYWMRDKNDPEVMQYLLDWNAYTQMTMQKTEELQLAIYNELLSRVEECHESFPISVGDYDYYTRQHQDQDAPILYRKHHNGGEEELLIDSNRISLGYDYFKIHNYAPSQNGSYIASAIDLVGTEYCTIFILDMSTKQFLPCEIIHNTNKSIIWNDVGNGFWYISVDSSFRSNRILFHIIGTDPSQDKLIYEETDPRCDLYLQETGDKRFILINSRSYTSSEAFYIDKKDSKSTPHLIASRVPDRQYYPESFQNHFYIRVKDGPHNNHIVITPITNPSSDNWKPYIASSEHSQILEHYIFKHHLVISRMERGLVKIEVHNLVNGDKGFVPFPDLLYSATVKEHQNFSGSQLLIEYSSSLTPESILAFDLKTYKLKIKKQRAVKDFDRSKYVLKRVETIVSDGTVIPISLFYRKDIEKKGPAPMLLYGYGAYEITVDNAFYDPELSLVDRGVICAIAHIRGGGECGRPWYEQGRVLNKRNSFTDFISAAEYLINEGYTTSDQLVIEGRSAGGTLVGAVINMRPELFKGAIAGVPFVDVMTTMSDLTIPYSTQDQEEWGDCSLRDHYYYMKSYSPYDNVERKNYPSLLITAAFHDAQVPFWEAAKWVAKLQEYKTDSNPLLFYTNMSAGHYSFSRRSLYLQELAFRFAFVLHTISGDSEGRFSNP